MTNEKSIEKKQTFVYLSVAVVCTVLAIVFGTTEESARTFSMDWILTRLFGGIAFLCIITLRFMSWYRKKESTEKRRKETVREQVIQNFKKLSGEDSIKKIDGGK